MQSWNFFKVNSIHQLLIGSHFLRCYHSEYIRCSNKGTETTGEDMKLSYQFCVWKFRATIRINKPPNKTSNSSKANISCIIHKINNIRTMHPLSKNQLKSKWLVEIHVWNLYYYVMLSVSYKYNHWDNIILYLSIHYINRVLGVVELRYMISNISFHFVSHSLLKKLAQNYGKKGF